MDKSDISLELSKSNALIEFVCNQLSHMYGLNDCERLVIERNVEDAIKRTLCCFSHIKNKYYTKDDINLLHSGQSMIFLYYLANTIFRNEIKGSRSDEEDLPVARSVCDKIYLLNKMQSCCEIYYEVEMPDYFFADHPLGSVIGRASIENGFTFSQGCTVGNNNNVYPVLGKNVRMFSNSKIIGNSHIGNNVLVGANCFIKDCDIPDNVMVFGQSPNLIIKENHKDKVMEMIDEAFE